MSAADRARGDPDLVIGVLGGMGPDATCAFQQAVLRHSGPVETDQQHVPLLVFNNPKVPDRNAALAGSGLSPAPVLATMARHGLARGEQGLQVYVMCEIPNNVLLIDEFSELFDGFSIGSNDLTQLTLGVDRDSAIVASAFDERDPGMLKMLKLAVEGARRNGRHSGICGQAPSDHLEIARYLVELGIDSISLTPDRLLKTMAAVQALEVEQAR